MTNTFLTAEQRQSLIDQYIDCYEETGGEDTEGMTICLMCLSNPELIAEVKASGWGIDY